MKKSILIAAFIAALAGLAVLPLSAAPRSATPSADLAKFFSDRGVDPQYLGKSKADVPEAVWQKINDIVAEPHVQAADFVGTDYTGDHDVLNSLVFASLNTATANVGDTIYLTLGNTTWQHQLTPPADPAVVLDIYGFPLAVGYPTPRA